MLVDDHDRGIKPVPAQTRKIFYLLALLAIFGWLYIFLQSSLFEINEVQVVGAKTIDPMDIEGDALSLLDQRAHWRPWSARQSLFINTTALATALQNKLFAQSITIQKISPHILRLSIQEDSHKMIIYDGQSFSWINLQGRFDDPLNISEGRAAAARLYGQKPTIVTDPPIVEFSSTDVDATSSGSIMTPDQVRQLISLHTALFKDQLGYRAFELNTPTSTLVTIINDQGRNVYVDIQDPTLITGELNTYKAFKTAQGQIKGASSYQYVDVRVPGMIFMK